MNSEKRETNIINLSLSIRLLSFKSHPFILYLCVVVWSLAFAGSAAFAAASSSHAIHLSASETLSTAGYFQLSWSGTVESAGLERQSGYATAVILQQSATPTFNSPTEWKISGDHRFSVSGLKSGNYFYRVGSNSSPRAWSNVVEVQVAHHSLMRAFGLFSLGAVLFLALVIVIFLNRHHNATGN